MTLHDLELGRQPSWLPFGYLGFVAAFLSAAIVCGSAHAEAPPGAIVIMAVDSRRVPDPDSPDGRRVVTFPIRTGVDEVARDLNGRGGLLGRTIKVTHDNDQCDAEEAAAVAARAVAMKVNVVIGHSCSSAAIRASVVYAEAGVVMIATGPRHPRLTGPSGRRGTHRLAGRDDRQADSIAMFLAAAFSDVRTAIIHDQSLQARGMADEMQRSLTFVNAPPTLIASYRAGQRDYAAVVEQMIAARPAAVLFAGQTMEASIILDQAARVGLRIPTLIGTDVLAAEQPPARLMAAVGEYLVMLPWPGSPSAPVSGAAPGGTPTDGDAATERLLGAVALELWGHAVVRANDVASDGVSAALRLPAPSRMGSLHFDDRGDVAVPPFLPHVWRDGRWQLRR